MAEHIPIGRDEQLEIYVTRHRTKLHSQHQIKTIVHLNVLTPDNLRGYRRVEKKGFELDASIVPLVFEQITKLIEKSGSK